MSWRQRRRWDVEHRIIHELSTCHGTYVLDLMRRTGLRAGPVYEALQGLEERGIVAADWDPLPDPVVGPTQGHRRRLYRLVGS